MATYAADIQPRRLMGLSPMHWLMLAIIAVALVYGGLSLRKGTVVSYASVPEAKQTARSVQVFGFLHNKGSYDAAGNWVFDIQGNNGDLMTVVYTKAKPANFEEAQSIVATGKYDSATKHFQADALLVKCPSKYQEQAKVAIGNATP
ncbi:MAG: cytochrome c maturation protein CcmE [Herpetosiphonaceae bacterium]|nr:cytochrome c maturation protein CcmE [Herpetosiphonaceae bacterium]